MNDDLSKRLAEPADDDILISRFEMAFGLPCYVTQKQQRQLHQLFDAIVSSPANQPVEGVHWLSGSGAKPIWSKADARLLGKETDENAPESGEPTFDDDVLFFESDARGFISEEERQRKLKERRK